ncbi:MAG: phage tail assembly chaperone [Ponticaulis sp.]|nr:phage tail assembly chaperone [Ponticaulis sp.]|tara:strand:+ start:220 stop:411 length:192 start_codon:yes stop_codon:yes gene_type:complete
MSASQALNWGAMLSAALRLGLTPPEFWRLSLREWQAISGRNKGASAFRKSDLTDLIARFPDGG